MTQNDPGHPEEQYALVYDAPDQATAEMVCATLLAQGLRAVVQNEHRGPAAGWLNYLGTSYGRGVLVPVSEADAAQAILAAQEPTEEEIIEAMEADGTTIEEAEARVK
jgi:hypothetical protein